MRSTLQLLFLLTLYQLSFCYERIKLKDVQALTFYRGRYTIGRKPIAQLSCSGHCKNGPKVAQCQNVGFDGVDYQWKCNADLDPNVKFSQISVNCEGYDYPTDPYIIAGSCGLEFSLSHRDHHGKSTDSDYSSSGPFWVFIGFFALCVGFMLCCPNDRTNGRSEYNYRGQPTAPPPSYSASPPPGFKTEYTDSKSQVPPTYQNSNNSGPGFWSGLGLGSLGGYFMGSRNSAYTTPPVYTDYYRPNRDSYNSYQDACYSSNDRSTDDSSKVSSTGTRISSTAKQQRSI